jgi:hypothetical protein
MHATFISLQPAVTTVRTAAAARTSLTDSRARRTNAELQRDAGKQLRPSALVNL